MSEQQALAKPAPRKPHSLEIDYEDLIVKFVFASRPHGIKLIRGHGPSSSAAVGIAREALDEWGLQEDVTVAELKGVTDAINRFLFTEVIRCGKKVYRSLLAGAVMARFEIG